MTTNPITGTDQWNRPIVDGTLVSAKKEKKRYGSGTDRDYNWFDRTFQESTDDEQFRFFNYGQSRSEVQENRELVELMIADQMRDLQERKERGEPLYTPDMPSDARVFRYTTSKGAPYPPGSTQEYYDWQKNQGPKGDQPDPYHSFPAVSVVTPPLDLETFRMPSTRYQELGLMVPEPHSIMYGMTPELILRYQQAAESEVIAEREYTDSELEYKKHGEWERKVNGIMNPDRGVLPVGVTRELDKGDKDFKELIADIIVAAQTGILDNDEEVLQIIYQEEIASQPELYDTINLQINKYIRESEEDLKPYDVRNIVISTIAKYAEEQRKESELIEEQLLLGEVLSDPDKVATLAQRRTELTYLNGLDTWIQNDQRSYLNTRAKRLRDVYYFNDTEYDATVEAEIQVGIAEQNKWLRRRSNSVVVDSALAFEGGQTETMEGVEEYDNAMALAFAPKAKKELGTPTQQQIEDAGYSSLEEYDNAMAQFVGPEQPDGMPTVEQLEKAGIVIRPGDPALAMRDAVEQYDMKLAGQKAEKEGQLEEINKRLLAAANANTTIDPGDDALTMTAKLNQISGLFSFLEKKRAEGIDIKAAFPEVIALLAKKGLLVSDDTIGMQEALERSVRLFNDEVFMPFQTRMRILSTPEGQYEAASVLAFQQMYGDQIQTYQDVSRLVTTALYDHDPSMGLNEKLAILNLYTQGRRAYKAMLSGRNTEDSATDFIDRVLETPETAEQPESRSRFAIIGPPRHSEENSQGLTNFVTQEYNNLMPDILARVTEILNIDPANKDRVKKMAEKLKRGVRIEQTGEGVPYIEISMPDLSPDVAAGTLSYLLDLKAEERVGPMPSILKGVAGQINEGIELLRSGPEVLKNNPDALKKAFTTIGQLGILMQDPTRRKDTQAFMEWEDNEYSAWTALYQYMKTTRSASLTDLVGYSKALEEGKIEEYTLNFVGDSREGMGTMLEALSTQSLADLSNDTNNAIGSFSDGTMFGSTFRKNPFESSGVVGGRYDKPHVFGVAYEDKQKLRETMRLLFPADTFPDMDTVYINEDDPKWIDHANTVGSILGIDNKQITAWADKSKNGPNSTNTPYEDLTYILMRELLGNPNVRGRIGKYIRNRHSMGTANTLNLGEVVTWMKTFNQTMTGLEAAGVMVSPAAKGSPNEGSGLLWSSSTFDDMWLKRIIERSNSNTSSILERGGRGIPAMTAKTIEEKVDYYVLNGMRFNPRDRSVAIPLLYSHKIGDGAGLDSKVAEEKRALARSWWPDSGINAEERWNELTDRAILETLYLAELRGGTSASIFGHDPYVSPIDLHLATIYRMLELAKEGDVTNPSYFGLTLKDFGEMEPGSLHFRELRNSFRMSQPNPSTASGNPQSTQHIARFEIYRDSMDGTVPRTFTIPTIIFPNIPGADLKRTFKRNSSRVRSELEPKDENGEYRELIPPHEIRPPFGLTKAPWNPSKPKEKTTQ